MTATVVTVTATAVTVTVTGATVTVVTGCGCEVEESSYYRVRVSPEHLIARTNLVVSLTPTGATAATAVPYLLARFEDVPFVEDFATCVVARHARHALVTPVTSSSSGGSTRSISRSRVDAIHMLCCMV